MGKCKHFGNFAFLRPIENDSSYLMKKLKKDDDLKFFLRNMAFEENLYYEELSDHYKKMVDEMYDERSEYDPSVRCSEHCGNTVREAQ